MPLIDPVIVKRGAVRYVAARERVARSQLATTVAPLLGEVSAFLRTHLVSPAGAPIVRYLLVDYNVEEVEIDVGFAITVSSLSPSSRVRIGELPGGHYATVTHRGSYTTLVDTTAALLEWGRKAHISWAMTEQNRVTEWKARVERYRIGPPAVTDPMQWRTEIAIRLADKVYA
jgi:effector-binding domain-containing protein